MHLKSTLFGLGLISAACMAANHDIQVGPDLIYSPNTTTAATGDTVTFHFFPGRHNVAQGQYNTPCVDLPGGFYSGFIAPDVGEANETFIVTINDTNPIWFYCTETMHCQLGMAGVINPP
jgi:plastocyanin